LSNESDKNAPNIEPCHACRSELIKQETADKGTNDTDQNIG